SAWRIVQAPPRVGRRQRQMCIKDNYNNGESTKNKKIITLLKKQMKDQVLLDLILSSLEGI
ncbi:hypothetical protein, partial [Enterococcus faecium]|uniref:hypothetical protein n=1 Tax=Enterococcus faecium TaxID=1352 RepID=UPI001E5A657A